MLKYLSFYNNIMGKSGRTISFDSLLLAEFDKRAIDLNELINQLLSEKLAFIQIREEEAERKRKAEAEKELESS